MATALMVASTAIGTVGSLVGASASASAAKDEGKAQEAMAEYHASQLRYKAGQERASSQKAAEGERRRGKLAQSRAKAVAAASGGGATAPTVMDILGRLRGQGEYNAQVALYEGEEAAKGLEGQADAAIAQGKYARAAGDYRSKFTKRMSYVQAAGNLAEGASTFYSKYWPENSPSSSGSVTQNKSGTKFGKYSSQVAYG
jgi:hypothetical protein